MAALYGLELSVNGGDVQVSAGTLDGQHVDAATGLDSLDASAINDHLEVENGVLVVLNRDDLTLELVEPDTTSASFGLGHGQIVLGRAGVASGAVTDTSYDDRGFEGWEGQDPAFYVDRSTANAE